MTPFYTWEFATAIFGIAVYMTLGLIITMRLESKVERAMSIGVGLSSIAFFSYTSAIVRGDLAWQFLSPLFSLQPFFIWWLAERVIKGYHPPIGTLGKAGLAVLVFHIIANILDWALPFLPVNWFLFARLTTATVIAIVVVRSLKTTLEKHSPSGTKILWQHQFVKYVGLTLLLVVGADIFFRMSSEHGVHLSAIFKKTIMIFLAVLFAYRTMSVNIGQFSRKSFIDVSITESIKRRIDRFIVNDKVFLKENLSSQDFANMLGTPEYIVRKIIINELGFKNFSSFLNHYRVQEAARFLEQPENEYLTVSAIAYQVGFSSLSPFNRSFKENFGVTPKTYRQQKMKAKPQDAA